MADLGAMKHNDDNDRLRSGAASQTSKSFGASARAASRPGGGLGAMGGLTPAERRVIEERIARISDVVRDLEGQLLCLRRPAEPPVPGAPNSPSSGPHLA